MPAAAAVAAATAADYQNTILWPNLGHIVAICSLCLLVFAVAEGHSIFLRQGSYSLWEATTVLCGQNWSHC